MKLIDIKIAGPNFSKNQKYLLRIHETFVPNEKCRMFQRNFPREFTEKSFAIFDQSSCAILLTWYCWLYFFLGISCGYPSDGSLKIFDKTLEGVNIIQFRPVPVTFGSMHFFFFQSLDVKASENLSRSQIFQLDLL